MSRPGATPINGDEWYTSRIISTYFSVVSFQTTYSSFSEELGLPMAHVRPEKFQELLCWMKPGVVGRGLANEAMSPRT